MKRGRNPFPGVSRATDRHGKLRWRYRRKGFSTYIHGAYGSAQFIREYEKACAGARDVRSERAAKLDPSTFGWLIYRYRQSPEFANLARITQKNRNGELEWIRENFGALPFARMDTRHVERMMAKKSGPSAANKLKKRLSALFIFAQRHGWASQNPARAAKARKENSGGYHTWSDREIDRFRSRWESGTKPLLALELCLNTGAARQDLSRLGWQSVERDRLAYQRGKTGQWVDLPLLPELAAELALVPKSQMLFLAHGTGRRYAPESLGNWFKECALEAGVSLGNTHGLRKAAARRLAEAGATENEIAAMLGHASTRQASTYTREAAKRRLTDAAFAKLKRAKGVHSLSNQNSKLDK